MIHNVGKYNNYGNVDNNTARERDKYKMLISRQHDGFQQKFARRKIAELAAASARAPGNAVSFRGGYRYTI